MPRGSRKFPERCRPVPGKFPAGYQTVSGKFPNRARKVPEHFPDTPQVTSLPSEFLLAVENAQQHFETNPLYYLLHEAIYCDGPGTASRWAAERVQVIIAYTGGHSHVR